MERVDLEPEEQSVTGDDPTVRRVDVETFPYLNVTFGQPELDVGILLDCVAAVNLASAPAIRNLNPNHPLTPRCQAG